MTLKRENESRGYALDTHDSDAASHGAYQDVNDDVALLVSVLCGEQAGYAGDKAKHVGDKRLFHHVLFEEIHRQLLVRSLHKQAKQ
jgi:hypothetical protein